jgi:hypothetical protein
MDIFNEWGDNCDRICCQCHHNILSNEEKQTLQEKYPYGGIICFGKLYDLQLGVICEEQVKENVLYTWQERVYDYYGNSPGKTVVEWCGNPPAAYLILSDEPIDQQNLYKLTDI